MRNYLVFGFRVKVSHLMYVLEWYHLLLVVGQSFSALLRKALYWSFLRAPIEKLLTTSRSSAIMLHGTRLADTGS